MTDKAGREAGQGVHRRAVVVGGHRLSFLEAGPADGPPVLLLHGLASDAGTWDRALEPMAARGLHVIAVDLLGHGESDKPPSGYLLDDFAGCLDEFLTVLGLPSATVCGHSLGGAIAVHLGYHFPARVDRLVLVSAGGLGREVHPVLRLATLRRAPAAVAWAMGPRLRRVYAQPRLHRMLRLTPDNVVNLRRAGGVLADSASRTAFFAALNGVIEWGGQRGSFIEMRYLDEHVPTLLVWSERDSVIPVAHAHATRRHLPNAELVIFPGGGHEPHRRNAQAFADTVADFIASH